MARKAFAADLGELGSGQVGDHHRRARGDRLGVHLAQHLLGAGRRAGGGDAEDEPARAQRVLDGVALAQELGVPRQHRARRPPGRASRSARATGRVPTGTVDLPTTRHGRSQQGREGLDGASTMRDVGRELAVALRCRHAEEVDVAELGALGEGRGEPQPPRLDVLAQQRLEARLVERRPAPPAARRPWPRRRRGPSDLEAELGHARGMGRPQVAAPHDTVIRGAHRSHPPARFRPAASHARRCPPPSPAGCRVRRLTDAPRAAHRGLLGDVSRATRG